MRKDSHHLVEKREAQAHAAKFVHLQQSECHEAHAERLVCLRANAVIIFIRLTQSFLNARYELVS